MENYIANNYDKWLHFLLMGMPVLWMLILAKTKTKIVIGFVLCFVIAAGKELVFDLAMGKGNPEFQDFLFSMILPTVGLIVSLKLNKNDT